MEKIIRYKKYLILASAFIALLLFTCLYVNEQKEENSFDIADNKLTKTTTTLVYTDETFYVDIKGAVSKPGVYAFKDGDKVIDAIKSAGGLTKNAITSNINLSQKLKSEMVIYIFTKSELSKANTTSIITTPACKCETIEVNNCIVPTTTANITATTKNDNSQNANQNSNDGQLGAKININTSDESNLMKVSGIGESKAKAIINYRNEHGLFITIDDIKNVSGIGESLFVKIKDYITV